MLAAASASRSPSPAPSPKVGMLDAASRSPSSTAPSPRVGMLAAASASRSSSPASAKYSYDQFLALEQQAGHDIHATKGFDSKTRISKVNFPLEARKMLSEFIGTFILIVGCAGTAIIASKPSSTFGIHGVAGGAAFTVLIVILSSGHISGAHVNPAVTLAFASLRQIPFIQVPLYIGAQFMGSICASFVLKLFFHSSLMKAGLTLPSGSSLQSFSVEIVISAIMMFVVTAVATDTQAVGDMAAIAVSSSVYLNNLLASGISGASMNPFRTMGPAIAANEFKGLWLYILGPILGTQIGAGLYTVIRSN